jgi:hypothetical protein
VTDEDTPYLGETPQVPRPGRRGERSVSQEDVRLEAGRGFRLVA